MLGSFMTYRVIWVTESQCAVAAYQPWQSKNGWSPLHVFNRFESEMSHFLDLEALTKRGCFRSLPGGELGDLRFALTPDSSNPLWVWSFKNGTWEREARRKMDDGERAHFKSLWLGEPQPGWTSEPLAVQGQ